MASWVSNSIKFVALQTLVNFCTFIYVFWEGLFFCEIFMALVLFERNIFIVVYHHMLILFIAVNILLQSFKEIVTVYILVTLSICQSETLLTLLSYTLINSTRIILFQNLIISGFNDIYLWFLLMN